MSTLPSQAPALQNLEAWAVLINEVLAIVGDVGGEWFVKAPGTPTVLRMSGSQLSRKKLWTQSSNNLKQMRSLSGQGSDNAQKPKLPPAYLSKPQRLDQCV